MAITERRYKDSRVVEVVEVKDANSKPKTKISSLDDIEKKMIELAALDSNDPLLVMMNEKKIAMLEKVANLKLKRLQLQELEKQNVTTEVQPIQIEFVNSSSDGQLARIDNIDKDILGRRSGGNNA